MRSSDIKRIVKATAYVLAMVCLVLWVINSNHIMVSRNKTLNHIEQVDTAQWRETVAPDGDDSVAYFQKEEGVVKASGAEVLWGLYGYRWNNDNLSSITFHGIACCETDESNLDRRVELVLVGRSHIYRIGTTLENAANNGRFWDRNLQGTMNNFITTFPTLDVKRDIYRVGIYVWENESTSGYVDTRMVFEKTATGLREYLPEVAPMAEDDSDSTVYMSSFTATSQALVDGCYNISGIAIKYGYDSAESDVYLNFIFEDGTQRTFATMLKDDATFNKIYSSNIYRYCWFVAKIPKKALHGKTAEIQVLIDNQGVTAYREKKLYYTFTDTGCEAVVEPTNPIEFEPEIDESLLVTNSSWIEPSVSRDVYTIKGNAWIDGHPVAEPEMYLKIYLEDDAVMVYPAQVGRSNWAANTLGEEYQMTNYTVKIATDSLGGEDFALQVLLKDGDTVYASQSTTYFIWVDGELTIAQ